MRKFSLLVILLTSVQAAGAAGSDVISKYCNSSSCGGEDHVGKMGVIYNLTAYCGTESLNRPATGLPGTSPSIPLACKKDDVNTYECNDKQAAFGYHIKWDITC